MLCFERRDEEYSIYVDAGKRSYTIPPRKHDLTVKYYLNDALQFDLLNDSKFSVSHKFLTYAANYYNLSDLDYSLIDDFINRSSFSSQLLTTSYWKSLYKAVQVRATFSIIFVLLLVFFTLLSLTVFKIWSYNQFICNFCIFLTIIIYLFFA